MFQLLMLLMIVVGSFGFLTFLGWWNPKWRLSLSFRGRFGLAIFFVFAGVSHFFMSEKMALMLPEMIPYRVLLIYITGVLEIAGGIGLLIPGWEKLSSVSLMLFLVAVLPANIYSAMRSVPFGGHVNGPSYLLIRVPFQFFLIGWAYYFGVRRLTQANTSREIASAGLEGLS